ncbi:hypothetical protein PspLS_11603 [Pyricularia sp. CBS 133598]|nr:hypothetical protein PspLS_11603 [Pyricularia sp. CBS 133598]
MARCQSFEKDLGWRGKSADSFERAILSQLPQIVLHDFRACTSRLVDDDVAKTDINIIRQPRDPGTDADH